jgi:SAM-dependent methyltransferase
LGQSVLDFYDELSEDYHLIFNDWDTSIKWHAHVIDKVIQGYTAKAMEEISLFDCSCGIGTQAIGLSLLGYNVHATDLSPKAVERAQREAERLGAAMTFGTADFRTLDKQVNGLFDVIITCDNSLPHLIEESDLLLTIKNISSKLKNGGLFLASIRDYDQIIKERPRFMSSNVFDDEQERRIVFQVWDWHENKDIYTLNQFIVRGYEDNWETTKRSTLYRAISRQELKDALEETGFVEVTWHMPEETGYYQPIITASKR